ncbi:restriction system-associated AAA family ATPase [Priestia aryabhattai]|uniref:restriction system-associated AAA family ATPase n=1 Tax=Priestia aryabhattai TaxID=412384 RepID=UPI001C8EEE62|nr:restriction system-associated AAA family ATPase [Priestia aryabhattai]MBX9986359.1 restriction system-associated AAA family ATPase [Priestia aryabhattai]MBY0001972.1 restriction system-associated AAA family ATPase [Priestia aryabhattai]
MKLIRMKINDPNGFRRLQKGFEIQFLRDSDYGEAPEFNPYILTGPNGSGKSNVLEALAAIFYHIECVYLKYRPESFRYDEEENPRGFRGESSTPDAFEIEYFIPVPKALNNKQEKGHAHIKIWKEVEKGPQVRWINRKNFDDDGEEFLSRAEVKEVLPKFILGYSSGENEILSLPFFKMRFIHFDEYRDRLIRDDFYEQAPEGRLIYLDDHFSQAILLSNLILQPKEVLSPFQNELNLKGVKEFRLLIGKHHYENVHEEIFFALPDNDKKEPSKTKKELTSKLMETIEKFEKCSTTKYTIFNEEGVEQYLVLDYFVTEATKEAFRFQFNDSPLELFQAFQILYTLNYYIIDQKVRDRIYQSKNIYLKQDMTSISLDEKSIFRIKEFRLDKDGIDEVVYTKSLSDGEHQFIHSIGLGLLFKEEPCLFLLDEPETHFNPNWRSKFISRLRDCFKGGSAQSVMREMLITTHTPFLISDSRQKYVLLFNKDERGERVGVSRPDFNTLGASVNKINIEAFGKTETIGGYAMQELNNLKKRFKEGESGKKIIKETNDLLGDSVEKVLFINEIIDSGDGQ